MRRSRRSTKARSRSSGWSSRAPLWGAGSPNFAHKGHFPRSRIVIAPAGALLRAPLLLSRKGGAHFETAIRVINGGGFSFDGYGHGRERPESEDDHQSDQIHREIDRQIDETDGQAEDSQGTDERY